MQIVLYGYNDKPRQYCLTVMDLPLMDHMPHFLLAQDFVPDSPQHLVEP